MAGSDASKGNISFPGIFLTTLAAIRNISQDTTSSSPDPTPTSTSSAGSSSTAPALQSAQPQVPSSSSGPAQSAASSATTPAPQPAQPQIATSSSSSGPTRSAVASRSAPPLPSNPYILSPTYNPVLGEHLPLELRNLVNEYQVANFNLLRLLLEHGLIRGEILGPQCLDDFDVQYQEVNDNGMTATIPYIFGGQYMELYDSIRRQFPINPAGLMEIRRELRHWVEIAIAGRSTVHDWHLRLPANDTRVANNPRHAAFLDMLIRLRNRL